MRNGLPACGYLFVEEFAQGFVQLFHRYVVVLSFHDAHGQSGQQKFLRGIDGSF